MNTMSLEEKNIIITGAASGIGRETALLCQKLGANLLLLDLNKQGLMDVKKCAGGGISVLEKTCDVTNFEQLKEIIFSAEKEIGKFHGAVHCAGIPSVVPLRALSRENYQRVQKINTEAGLDLAKIFSSRGIYNKNSICSIVFLSSVYGVVGSACNTAYSVSKAAVVGLTKSLAIELAPKKIRVNCIAPGFIKTNMADGVNAMFDERYADRIEAMHPLGWGEASDIAWGIAFLLADVSKWTTGAVFPIDGGFTAQ